MKRTILLLFPALACAATIDQYLNAPFASGLSAAPSGGRIVWLLNERGAHNLWVAAAPDFTSDLLPQRLSEAQRRTLRDEGSIVLPSSYDPAASSGAAAPLKPQRPLESQRH